jgi:hypothetical protein
MGRTYITVGVIIFLLGAGSYWHGNYINQSANSLVEKLDRVEELIQIGQWDEAQREMARMENEWKGTKKTWSILIHHQEIDNIEISLKRVEKYVVAKNSLLGLGELSALRLLVDHISDTETLSIQNIF